MCVPCGEGCTAMCVRKREEETMNVWIVQWFVSNRRIREEPWCSGSTHGHWLPVMDDSQVCVCVCLRVQVGVNVQLIQVITIYREAVKTQIAKWRMALYICMHVYVSTGEHMSSLSLRPSRSLHWVHHNNSTRIAHVQTLDQVQIKNPVLPWHYLFIHGWFQLKQHANLWLIASVCVCVRVNWLHATMYAFERFRVWVCVHVQHRASPYCCMHTHCR